MLASSPVYALVQGHMAGLCRRADELASSASAGTIGDATLELVRAMISSAGRDDAHSDSVMNETLYTRIVAFIQQNLTDPGLSPERIARQHHISVRQLYKLWGHNELSHTTSQGFPEIVETFVMRTLSWPRVFAL